MKLPHKDTHKICGLHYKTMLTVMMLQVLERHSRAINCIPRVTNRTFILLASLTIIIYDCKTFIVKATVIWENCKLTKKSESELWSSYLVLGYFMLSCQPLSARYLIWENLKVVLAKFSTLNYVILIYCTVSAWHDMQPLLELKTWPRVCPISQSQPKLS